MKKFVLFVLFSLILISNLVYFFYSTDLRQRLEWLLLDIRTTLKPQVLTQSRVAIVSIDRTDLTFLSADQAPSLSESSLISILDATLASGADAIGLLLPHQDFDYESRKMQSLVRWIKAHPQGYLGIFDYHQIEPSKQHLPEILRPIDTQVAGASTLRLYTEGVVREAPLLSYLGDELVPQLCTLVARRYALASQSERLEHTIHEQIQEYQDRLTEKRNNYVDTEAPGILINYWSADRFVHLSARELMESKISPKLQGKIVLIGYTVFRSREMNYQEGTFINIPREGENSSEQEGTPLIFVSANILENLLSSSWLEEAPTAYAITQTLIFVILSFAIWRMAPALAVILFIIAFTTLFLFHGFLFSYANLVIPMADTLIFSILAAIIGAFWRAQEDDKRRALRAHGARKQRKLALVQSRFLNRFAFELFDINQQIERILSPHQDSFAGHQLLHSTFQKALSSCAELNDYLSGIKHYSLLNQVQQEIVKKQRVSVEPLLRRILSQFETLIEEKKIRIVIDEELACDVWSDEVLLEPILFNLVSNALKYSPVGGEVSIRIAPLDYHWVAIYVRDQGCGIPLEYQELIFEKFYRIKDDNSYRVKGNGLGLYLCRYFGDKIGAKIHIESSSAQGSQFSLVVEKYRES